jgi:hypothetical protein
LILTQISPAALAAYRCVSISFIIMEDGTTARFGQRLREMRELATKSQAQLEADRVITRAELSSAENNYIELTQGHARRLEAYLLPFIEANYRALSDPEISHGDRCQLMRELAGCNGFDIERELGISRNELYCHERGYRQLQETDRQRVERYLMPRVDNRVGKFIAIRQRS